MFSKWFPSICSWFWMTYWRCLASNFQSISRLASLSDCWWTIEFSQCLVALENQNFVIHFVLFSGSWNLHSRRRLSAVSSMRWSRQFDYWDNRTFHVSYSEASTFPFLTVPNSAVVHFSPVSQVESLTKRRFQGALSSWKMEMCQWNPPNACSDRPWFSTLSSFSIATSELIQKYEFL